MKVEIIERELENISANYIHKIRSNKSKIENKHNKINFNNKQIIDTSKYIENLYEDVNYYFASSKSMIKFAIKTTPIINIPVYRFIRRHRNYYTNILFKMGVHFITALQGGGKSSLAYDLAEEIYYETGKAAYINADFEKARFNPAKQKWVRHHQRFKLSEFFNAVFNEATGKYEVKQLKKFNRHMETIILDEWLTEMNHRNNKSRDYNDIFMALITMIAHMRHQGVKRIYVLSQINNTDTQLSSMFKFHHEVEVKLGNDYWEDFQKNANIDDRILGWYVSSYKLKRNRKQQNTERILVGDQYRKATADFKYFDTYSMASKYDDLREDKIRFT